MGLVEEMAREEEEELEGQALLVVEKGLPAIEVIIYTSIFICVHQPLLKSVYQPLMKNVYHPDEGCFVQNVLPVFTIPTNQCNLQSEMGSQM